MRSHKKKGKKDPQKKKRVRLLPLPLIVHYEIHGQPNYVCTPIAKSERRKWDEAQIVDAHMHVFLQRKIFVPTPTYGGGVSAGIMVVMSPFHCINGFDERL